jgi:hypothetical protein
MDYDKVLTPADVLRAQMRALYSLGREHGEAAAQSVPPASVPDYSGVAAPFASHDLVSVAPLLWVLWNHQGAGSPVGQPIRRYLGMGQFERMSEEQVKAARDWASIPFPVQSSPLAGGLVDRVCRQLPLRPVEVSAVIREVAEWLRAQGDPYANAWATSLEQEVDR